MIVIQPTLDEADHEQPEGVVTLSELLPPEEGNERLEGPTP